jgi:hypothetical protein
MELFGLHIHHKIDPWQTAPAWALELREMLSLLLVRTEIITGNTETIMSALDDALTQAETAAKANSDAEDAVETLLTTLSTQIANLKTTGTDPATIARIQALATALTAKASTLAAAVVANTPAAAPPAGP